HLHEVAHALELYDEAIALAGEVDRRNFSVQQGCIQAYQALCDDRTDVAVTKLRGLLAQCREQGYHGFLRQTPEVIAPLFALALSHGIETDFVGKLIRERRLAAPSPDNPQWPWPVAVQTLGAFRILREGVPVESKGKAQKKPLELLKALIAHGADNVDAAMLTTQLWPDAEGDAARTSLDSTVYRLRK